MDRELNQVNVACGEFTSRQEEGKVVLDDVVGLLDSVNQKVSSLKSKVSLSGRMPRKSHPHLLPVCRLKNV